MKEEITAAVLFLTRLIGKSDAIDGEKMEALQTKLMSLLTERFRNHWFPEKPTRGQAYRCIRVNENDRLDPTLIQACREVGIKYNDLRLPIELTLWVDPEEVTCRFGEHKGSFCVIAKFRDGSQENFIDQINVDELEQRSLERAKQASFDLINSRKRKQQMMNGRHKNGYFAGDYLNLIPTTTSPSYYSHHATTYYGSSPPYASPYGSSPPQNHNLFKYPVSPPQNRSLGGTPYRTIPRNGYSGTTFGSIGSNGSNKFSRGLQSAFNSAAMYGYPQNDKFHWVNKSIVKA